MVRGADILVLSSHNADIIRTWCSRVLWLEQGCIKADGQTASVLDTYFGHPHAAEPVIVTA